MESDFKKTPVRKDVLIGKIQENRAKHRQAFEEAMDGYKARAIEMLEDHIERINNGRPERVMVSLPMPTDHTEDYDLALQMLEWSQADLIWLDSNEFDQYVRDNWFWKEEFLTTASLYQNSGRHE